MPRRADQLLNLVGPRPTTPRKRSIILVRSRPNSQLSRPPSQLVTPYSPSGDDFPSIDNSQPSAKISVVENRDGDVELVVDNDGPVLFSMLEETDIEGVRHLKDSRHSTRYIWATVILVFALLAAYQIYTQVQLYVTTPISTNIEADYPSEISFPVVAVCNNNQYRLTYLTGLRLQNRKPTNETDVFDRALASANDMDAKNFLHNAGHWKRKMILGCTWPNGSRCSHRDFRELWTLTGLCWAINTDPINPLKVYGAGPRHAIKLLLNIERYERIESCSPRFRTNSLPGLKILLFNQTDSALSSMEGVNVPPGYTWDIPYRMQHRQKFAGGSCEKETEEQKAISISQFDHPENVRTCVLRKFLQQVEAKCNCSMRKAYDPKPNERFPVCNVAEYYSCVQPLQRKGFSTYDCRPPCEQVDYIAWQDMQELPDNIFPKIQENEMEDHNEQSEEEDEDDEQEPIIAEFKCENNQLLEDKTIAEIKRSASLAYEKQSRYQVDIVLRIKKLVTRLNQTARRLLDLRWGWREDDFVGVHMRLYEVCPCFANMTDRHRTVFDAIRNPQSRSEEHRSRLLFQILAPLATASDKYKTLSDVKREFGERAEKKLAAMIETENLLELLAKIYDKTNYNHYLSEKLLRMDKILSLMQKYENGTLQKKAWAEKMKTRNMRRFFEEDIYEYWYNPIIKDLDSTILKTIRMIEDILPEIKDDFEIGSIILFGDSTDENRRAFADFMTDILGCTMRELRNQSAEILEEFQKAMHNFQFAYANLFQKELQDYLQNFAFGPKFVQENFALVNVFLHKMNVETWKQDSTYSIWSLFCDVGGALGFCKPKSQNCLKNGSIRRYRLTDHIRNASKRWRKRKEEIPLQRSTAPSYSPISNIVEENEEEEDDQKQTQLPSLNNDPTSSILRRPASVHIDSTPSPLPQRPISFPVIQPTSQENSRLQPTANERITPPTDPEQPRDSDSPSSTTDPAAPRLVLGPDPPPNFDQSDETTV
ncbi:Na+ channel, amiloride-sensitive family-containing protein [Aphelenchoides besseyi]|nr:Na+ channel, amiloride-sensitive family-containing protein [Aphelenchoides besseyi]